MKFLKKLVDRFRKKEEEVIQGEDAYEWFRKIMEEDEWEE